MGRHIAGAKILCKTRRRNEKRANVFNQGSRLPPRTSGPKGNSIGNLRRGNSGRNNGKREKVITHSKENILGSKQQVSRELSVLHSPLHLLSI